jgi:hypothetical protein
MRNRQIKQHLSNYVRHFDTIEILTVAAGVLVVPRSAMRFLKMQLL